MLFENFIQKIKGRVLRFGKNQHPYLWDPSQFISELSNAMAFFPTHELSNRQKHITKRTDLFPDIIWCKDI